MSKFGNVFESRSVLYSNVSQTGFGGEPPAAEAMGVWGQSNFLKKSYFNTIASHYARIQSHFKVLDF